VNLWQELQTSACKILMVISGGVGRLKRWENNFKLEVIQDCVKQWALVLTVLDLWIPLQQTYLAV
jgi:hypothetical protein